MLAKIAVGSAWTSAVVAKVAIINPQFDAIVFGAGNARSQLGAIVAQMTDGVSVKVFFPPLKGGCSGEFFQRFAGE